MALNSLICADMRLRNYSLTHSLTQGCVDPTSPNLAIGRSFLHKKFVSAFGYLAEFSNAGGPKLSDVENDPKFHTF